MTHIPKVLFSLLVATTLAAQSADLRVTLEGDLPAAAEPGTVLRWTMSLENLGPDIAEHVRYTSSPLCFDVTLAAIAPGQIDKRSCEFTVPADLFYVLVAGTAGSPTNRDPNPDNDVAVRFVDVVTPPDLKVDGGFGFPADPGLPFAVFVSWANLARVPATGVTITATFTGVVGFVNLPANCAADGNRVVCTLGRVEASPVQGPRTGGNLVLQPIAPDVARTAVPMTMTLEILGNEVDFHPPDNTRSVSGKTFRTFFVTNANDSGPDSFRSVIEETNAACQDDVQCKIAFRIPAATGVVTLRPGEPLPVVSSVNHFIDGTTQTRYIGDTNPHGPEIEISGSELTSFANGLTLDGPCTGSIRGLVINGFQNNGILVGSGGCTPAIFFTREIADNYIGTDPTGTRAIPNQRGIYVEANSTYRISGNLISGNSRSGVFVAKGIGSVVGNTIGLNATLTAPLGNGASGVYIAEPANDVVDNYIGFNAHFGVSIRSDAHHVSIRGNSFQANGQLAIDFGLDGFTAEVPDQFGGGMVRVPEITAAVYDAVANKTIIEGRAVRRGETTFVHVYTNDAPDPSGFGEGQYFLGTTTVDTQGRFRFEVSGRLPGPWVAATVTQYTILGLRGPKVEDFGAGAGRTTSEFSRTVRVE